MQSPAIQGALDNLVEAIRTALMAEFLELLRDGRPRPAQRKRKPSPGTAKKKVAKARPSRKTKAAAPRSTKPRRAS
jgi:hypothetical protein